MRTERRDCISEVKAIFEDYFGEDKVDLVPQNDEGPARIIVYFPQVTVTNEAGNSEIIYDLFAKTPITSTGKMVERFQLKRATYTKKQAVSGYTHSHISRNTPLGEWGTPCLGTGPINLTITTLEDGNTSFDSKLPIWELYCRELDEYTQVESLHGGPYIKMSDIGYTNRYSSLGYYFLSSTDKSNMNVPPTLPIAKALLASNKLKFNFDGQNIQLAMSDAEFAILATRAAKALASREDAVSVFENSCFECMYKDGTLHRVETQNPSFLSPESREVIVFKGQSFRLRILEDDEVQEVIHTFPMLSIHILLAIKSIILYIVNLTYGKSDFTEGAILL